MYQVIYADPPWRYSDKRKSSLGGAENHYPTMCIQDICDLPIKDLAAEDSLLFMWVTFPTLIDAMKVFPAWGFQYKTLGFTWIKTNKRQVLEQQSFLPHEHIDDFFGIGAYTKSNAEICLIGTKGKGSQLVVDNSVPSTIIAPRKRHSQKPDEARQRIEKLTGGKARMVELFARNTAEGWDRWGNEVDNTVEIQ